MAIHKCKFPESISIKLDEKIEVDPCIYELMEEHQNVTVRVYRCPRCRTVDISWERQNDTKSTIFGILEE